MSTPSETKAQLAHVNEVLAYRLAHWLHLHSSDHETVGKTDEQFAQHWRDNSEFRDKSRKRAQSLVDSLRQCGASVRASNSRLILKSVEEMVTVPAKAAYSLMTEEAPFSQQEEDAPKEPQADDVPSPSGLGAALGFGSSETR